MSTESIIWPSPTGTTGEQMTKVQQIPRDAVTKFMPYCLRR